MGKSLYIAEKPSVAQEFAKALNIFAKRKDGYLESEEAVVTWCVGHLVTMSYPEEYDPSLKRWSLETLPFQIRSNPGCCKTVPDRGRVIKQSGCGYNLCLYRLRARRRIYLPPGGAAGTGDRQEKASCVD